MTSELQHAEVDGSDVGRFLAITAAALRETAERLDATVDRISAKTATQSGRADRDMVMALQNFDRLQQEFAAIADVLGKAAEKVRGNWATTGGGHPADEVLAAISMTEVKERFLRLLSVTDWLASTSDEAVF